MKKRERFILETFCLATGFLAVQFVEFSFRIWAILTLGLVAYFFTAWNIREDLKKISWLTVLPLPSFYTVSFSLFYFLLPEVLITRVFILILYSIGIYAILLTSNIYSVAAYRTIQLLRAAQAVGFFITLVSVFLLYDTIFSYRFDYLFNGFFVFLVSFFLIVPSLWSIMLEDRLSKKILLYSLILSLCIGEFSIFISFWPLTITASSLFLVTAIYIGLGIVQSYFNGKLFEKTLKEYLQVGVIVFIITFFLASWT